MTNKILHDPIGQDPELVWASTTKGIVSTTKQKFLAATLAISAALAWAMPAEAKSLNIPVVSASGTVSPSSVDKKRKQWTKNRTEERARRAAKKNETTLKAQAQNAQRTSSVKPKKKTTSTAVGVATVWAVTAAAQPTVDVRVSAEDEKVRIEMGEFMKSLTAEPFSYSSLLTKVRDRAYLQALQRTYPPNASPLIYPNKSDKIDIGLWVQALSLEPRFYSDSESDVGNKVIKWNTTLNIRNITSPDALNAFGKLPEDRAKRIYTEFYIDRGDIAVHAEKMRNILYPVETINTVLPAVAPTKPVALAPKPVASAPAPTPTVAKANPAPAKTAAAPKFAASAPAPKLITVEKPVVVVPTNPLASAPALTPAKVAPAPKPIASAPVPKLITVEKPVVVVPTNPLASAPAPTPAKVAPAPKPIVSAPAATVQSDIKWLPALTALPTVTLKAPRGPISSQAQLPLDGMDKSAVSERTLRAVSRLSFTSVIALKLKDLTKISVLDSAGIKFLEVDAGYVDNLNALTEIILRPTTPSESATELEKSAFKNDPNNYMRDPNKARYLTVIIEKLLTPNATDAKRLKGTTIMIEINKIVSSWIVDTRIIQNNLSLMFYGLLASWDQKSISFALNELRPLLSESVSDESLARIADTLMLANDASFLTVNGVPGRYTSINTVLKGMRSTN